MMTKLIKILTFIVAFFAINCESRCAEQGEECSEDCDCCTKILDPVTERMILEPNVRCEIRNKKFGRRCYFSRVIGSMCNTNSDCKSQNCVRGFCLPNSRKFRPVAQESMDINELFVIKGSLPLSRSCPCPDPAEATRRDVFKVLDRSLDTNYVNNYPINSGLTLQPDDISAPLKEIKICNSKDCDDCDPTSYKIEGSCEKDSILFTEGSTARYYFIQEGKIDFKKRGECISIPVGKRGFFDHYRLTFPTRKGDIPSCEKSCSTYPIKISSVTLKGKKNQVATSRRRLLGDVSGEELKNLCVGALMNE